MVETVEHLTDQNHAIRPLRLHIPDISEAAWKPKTCDILALVCLNFLSVVGSGDIDTGDRFCAHDQPLHRCGRCCRHVQHAVLKQFGIGEEQRCIPPKQHQSRLCFADTRFALYFVTTWRPVSLKSRVSRVIAA